ncbi:sensor histidine kinase [Halorientalis halophila]|uniref:sensor histidine kinase n=1 Tax=Halorientalis halophila TaxID=3108499 RepID=UPI00300BE200
MIDDGTPIVESVNDPFEEAFEKISSGTAVTAALDNIGIRPRSPTTRFEAVFSGSGRLAVQVSCGSDTDGHTEQYLVQSVPPEPSDDGFLVFTHVRQSCDFDDGAEWIDVDHVASVVSHDLRNPLDVAKARLRAGRESGEREHFDHVEQAHGRMERIIQDVLTLARGADVVEPAESVGLTDVAESAWDTVETDDATLDVERPLPTAIADADRVSRLFENLFRNAVEHGSSAHQPAGLDDRRDVTVVVGQLAGDASGFFVADDGPGISEAERERVFEPGFSSDEHGTGLGLAIVARIVALHGWSITVTESASGGARFEIGDVESPGDET